MIWEEKDLVNIRNRDPNTFGKVYKEYSTKIYNFLLFKTNGNKNIAEEIFSETFYSALKSAPKLNDINKVLSWLLQIANRRYLDYLRKKYRENKISYEDNEQLIDSQLFEKNNDAEITENRLMFVKLAIDSIDPKYQEIIKLKYNEHKKQKEIADILNKSESAIENLLFKARIALKNEIKNLMRDL